MTTTEPTTTSKPRRRWLQFSPRTLLVVVLICSIPCGCTPALHRGIVYTESAAIGVVKNGTAFDRAELALGEHHTVVIPTRSTLVRSTGGNSIVIEMEKSLGFMGHPPERYTIDEERRDMGCVWLSKAGRLHLATFGESSTPEGGQTVELEVTVPDEVAVERDDQYEMSRTGNRRVRSSELRRFGGDGDTWYTSKDSDERWLPIADVPNPERAAQHKRGR